MECVLCQATLPHGRPKTHEFEPFEGVTFNSPIAATLVNGRIAYADGQVNDAVRGQRPLFDR